MIRDARQRIRAWKGAGLMFALMVSAFAIFFLDNVVKAFERRYTVVVVMESAPRLVQGSPVWIGGKRVGTVTQVGFMPSDSETTNNVAVTVELPRKYRTLVRGDTRARITSVRRIGEPVVDLLPGTRAAAMLAEGDTVEMRRGVSIDELTTRARIVRTELDTALRAMQALMPAVQTRMSELRRSFVALESSMAQARQLRQALAAGPGIAQLRDPALSAALQRSRAHAAELSKLLAASRQRVSQGELRNAFTNLQQHADSLRAELDALSFETGFFARSRSDTAIARAILAARTELDSLIAQTKRNPLRFFF